MLCPVCHHDNYEGEDACDNCGADLSAADLPEPALEFHDTVLGDHLNDLGFSQPEIVDPELGIAEAIRRMHEARTDCLLVCEAGILVGIFTDRDAVVKATDKRLGLYRVQDFMTPDPVVLRPRGHARGRGPQDGRRRVPPHPRRRRRPPAGRRGRRGGRVPAHRRRARLSGEPVPAPSMLRIAVLADDLIWATRLADGVRRAGGDPGARCARLRRSRLRCPNVDGAIVDLTTRAYDALDALRAATAAGVPAIAVGQHDDAALRRAAREAGASRVHAYRALFEHGDRELAAWVSTLAATREDEA